MVVSKGRSVEDILQLYEEGQRDFGENRVQELLRKREQLPGDIRWHMIGTLQTNKVKYLIGWIDLIHSVDRLHLFEELEKRSARANAITRVLIQIYIAQEPTKHGMSWAETEEFFRQRMWERFPHVQICGLMGMATYTSNTEQVRKEFTRLASFLRHIQERYVPHWEHFKELSMGMSNDWQIAVEAGATIVRIGSLFFE